MRAIAIYDLNCRRAQGARVILAACKLCIYSVLTVSYNTALLGRRTEVLSAS